MKEYYYIKNNSQEIRDKLQSVGYRICHCCTYVDSQWLAVYPKNWDNERLAMTVHGIGYGCDNDCKDSSPAKCIFCTLNKTEANFHIFNDAESCLEYIQKAMEK